MARPDRAGQVKNVIDAEIAIICAENNEFVQQLIGALQARHYQAAWYPDPPASAQHVISLLAWQSFATIEQAMAANLANFQLAKAIAKRFQEQGGLFALVQDTGGQFGLSACSPLNAWAAGGSGLIKTAAHEWPKAKLKVIDLAHGILNSQQLAEKLAQEIVNNNPEIEVGLAENGERFTIEGLEDRNPGQDLNDISPQSVFVVSGGARGVTAACLKELARVARPHIALLGRTELSAEPSECQSATSENELKTRLVALARQNNQAIVLPEIQKAASKILANREVRQTLQELEALGAKVKYYACDVQNPEQVSAVVKQIEQVWGPVSGLIHGAGVLADKLIKDKTETQFTMVFNTKVKGFQALLNATANQPLRHIILFSSVAGRFGNAGQCDYAMANEVLNKIAQTEQRRRGSGCVVKALNWGPWEAGMVSVALKEHFQQQQISLLPMQTGVQLFMQELRHQAPGQVELVLGSSLPKPKKTNVFSVSATTHSYLQDHSVKNAPVLPICLVLEWLLRTARIQHPQLNLQTCENVRVLKPIRLENFSQTSSFIIKTESQANRLLLRLYDQANDTLHYSAELPLQDKSELPDPVQLKQSSEIWPWKATEIYQQGLIFHGPAFQVIESLAHLAEEEATGTVLGIKSASKVNPQWLNNDWLLDVAALDGGLQIAWLYSYLKIKAGLPMAIKRFKIYKFDLINQPLTVTIQRVRHNAFSAIFDLQYRSTSGELVAEFSGIEEVFMRL